MKRVLSILLLVASCLPSLALTVTNEIDGTFNSTSYDDVPNLLWGNYFATFFYNGYPQYTNHIYSWSRGGSGFELDYEAQEEKWCLPFWASFAVPGYDWILANDNGGYVSNDVVHWGTNIFAGPAELWNGTAKTNEGVSTVAITHQAMGNILADTPGGDSGSVSRNAGSMYLNTAYSTPVVDLWHMLGTNGVLADIVGARQFGFYTGGHPYPAGHLCMALWALIALGAETNTGSFTLDWNNQIVAATNKLTVINPSLAGNVLSCTVHFDRMPLAWDVPDGTITNDARNAFVLMPQLASFFTWTIQVTNLPAGNYNVFVDGVLTDTATAAELAAGRNWFTNYNGPLWAQRKEVLGRKRDQEGVDRVTLVNHSAGVNGPLGVPDMINYKSHSAGWYDSLGHRGATYVSDMATDVSAMRQYDTAIHSAAVQTNHTFSFVLTHAASITTTSTGTLHFGL